MNAPVSDPTELDVDPTAVIVGVDGSEAADDAARAAAVEAVARHAPLVLVHAFDWPSAGVEGLPTGVDGRSVARRSAARDLARLAASITDRPVERPHERQRGVPRNSFDGGGPGRVVRCLRAVDTDDHGPVPVEFSLVTGR